MLLSCAAISLFLAAAAPAEPGAAPAEMRPARDGNVAIREELEAARTAATVAAYDLFIARHPDHPLTKVAREERQRLIDRHKGRAAN
jgi:hypothetical protein